MIRRLTTNSSSDMLPSRTAAIMARVSSPCRPDWPPSISMSAQLRKALWEGCWVPLPPLALAPAALSASAWSRGLEELEEAY